MIFRILIIVLLKLRFHGPLHFDRDFLSMNFIFELKYQNIYRGPIPDISVACPFIWNLRLWILIGQKHLFTVFSRHEKSSKLSVDTLIGNLIFRKLKVLNFCNNAWFVIEIFLKRFKYAIEWPYCGIYAIVQ